MDRRSSSAATGRGRAPVLPNGAGDERAGARHRTAGTGEASPGGGCRGDQRGDPAVRMGDPEPRAGGGGLHRRTRAVPWTWWAGTAIAGAFAAGGVMWRRGPGPRPVSG